MAKSGSFNLARESDDSEGEGDELGSEHEEEKENPDDLPRLLNAGAGPAPNPHQPPAPCAGEVCTQAVHCPGCSALTNNWFLVAGELGANGCCGHAGWCRANLVFLTIFDCFWLHLLGRLTIT